MPPKAKIKFLSPSYPRLRDAKPPIAEFPVPVLRGIIRGILKYAMQEGRRSRVKDVTMDAIEHQIMQLAENSAGLFKREGGDTDKVINFLVVAVADTIENLIKPMYYVLSKDSDLILEELTHYGEINGYLDRRKWLEKKLPRLLSSIKESLVTPPTTSKCKTSVPQDAELDEWACNGNVAELRNKILGHFHGLSEETVKRRLSMPPRVPTVKP